ncbi:cold shock domain-containing protein [Streptomyces sp. NPDC007084]|uniref:cold-shock protein n=1 Tax=Streptomyces sp. NPDC007084 TaxID=3154313 RepID=UPI003451C2E4
MGNHLRAGKVLSFDAARGFGVIAPYGSDEDLPFHAQSLKFVDHLTQGQTVIYAIEQADAGVRAVEVRPA